MATGDSREETNAVATGMIINSSQMKVNGPQRCTSNSEPTFRGIVLHFTLRGELVYRLSNRAVSIDPDRFLVLSADSSYTCLTLQRGERTTPFRIELSAELLNEALASLSKTNPDVLQTTDEHGIPIVIERCIEMDPWMKVIVKTMHETLASQSSMSEELHLQIAERILEINFQAHRDADALKHLRRSTRLDIYRRLMNAKEYIDMNYNTNLQLEELSMVACLSKHHFKRLFKELFKYSPHQYLTMVRIRQALKLLKHSTIPVNEVSGSIGFQNTSSFIRLFRNTTGVTPMHYRANAA